MISRFAAPIRVIAGTCAALLIALTLPSARGRAEDHMGTPERVRLVQKSRANGGNVEIKLYPDATHSFDSAGRKRQSIDANEAATEDAVEQSLRFFARYLGGRVAR